jgi:hypothetical protein
MHLQGTHNKFKIALCAVELPGLSVGLVKPAEAHAVLSHMFHMHPRTMSPCGYP